MLPNIHVQLGGSYITGKLVSKYSTMICKVLCIKPCHFPTMIEDCDTGCEVVDSLTILNNIHVITYCTCVEKS